jgi:hypothetical protein
MSDLLWTSVPGTDFPILLIVAVVALWLLVRNRATALASPSALDALIGRGEPVVLEFFGNT